MRGFAWISALLLFAACDAGDLASMPEGVDYLDCFPEASDAPWAEETQGVAHEGHSWLVSSKWAIYRYDVDSQLGDQGITAVVPAPDGCEHIGDIDVVGDTLVVPLEHCPEPAPSRIYLYDARTLEVRGGSAVTQTGAPWAALDPVDGRVYSSAFDARELVAYDTGGELGDTLQQAQTIRLDTACSRVQGGVFAPDGRLFLVCDDREHSERAGILEVELTEDGARLVAQIPPRVAPDADAELEGIDFWNLEQVPGRNHAMGGQLHYMSLNNDSFNSDNASFEHLSIPSMSSF